MLSQRFPLRARWALPLVAGALVLGAGGLRAQNDATPASTASATPTPEVTASPTPENTPLPAQGAITPAPTLASTATAAPTLVYPSAAGAKLAGSHPGNEAAGTANLAATFLVLAALCAGGYYLLRRQPGFVAGLKSGPRKLNVSETRSLGNRQFLVVVEYENERMLLGVTPGKIDYLCPLRAPGAEGTPVFPVPGGANP